MIQNYGPDVSDEMARVKTTPGCPFLDAATGEGTLRNIHMQGAIFVLLGQQCMLRSALHLHSSRLMARNMLRPT